LHQGIDPVVDKELREHELSNYWRTISYARSILRVNPSADTREQQDDLDNIAFSTNWPRLKIVTGLAVVSLITPLSLDLSVFDLWPHEVADIVAEKKKAAE
jgi:hypothetical protein